MLFTDTGETLSFASSDHEGKVYLWNVNKEEPLGELAGHTLRVAQVAFHPSCKLLGSASYDYSWRLWDIEAGVQILLQEGHSRPVHCIDFQRDGALVVTG